MKLLCGLLLLAGAVWADETITAMGKTFSVRKAADWKGTPEGLELLVKDEPGVPRRPKQFAILQEGPFKSFTLEVEVKRNGKSLALAYAHQDEGHFNYALISVDDPAKQRVHNGVFHVFGGERVRISSLEGGPGLLPSADWTKVKLVWDGKTGEVRCWADGKTSEALHGVDLSLKSGRVGLGSFNETGSFRNLKVSGVK
jgi:hypothetical protein